MLKITKKVVVRAMSESGCGKNWDNDCGIRAKHG